MHVLRWFIRLPFWLFLILREMEEMGEAAVLDYVMFLTLGTMCFIVMGVGVVMFEQFGTELPPWFIIPGAVYLLLGVFLFFLRPLTNAPVHWTQNGAW